MCTDSDSNISDEHKGDATLGVVLTLVMMLAYFGFIGLGAFAPDVLALSVVKGGTTTVAFAYLSCDQRAECVWGGSSWLRR